MQLPRYSNRLVHFAANLAPPLIGGLCALLAGLILRGLLDTRLPAEIVVDASTDSLQPRGFSFLLDLLGPAGKPLLFAGVLLGELALYAIVWRQIAMRGQVLLAGAVAALVLIAATALLVSLTEATLGSQTNWLEYGIATFLRAGVFAVVAGYTLLAMLAAAGDEADVPARRRFIGLAPAAIGALALYLVGREVLRTGGGGVQGSSSGEPTSEITPTEDFYIVSKNLFDPDVDAHSWSLTIGGISDRTLELTYDDLVALPAFEQYATLECISNEVGGNLISTARWKGILLRDLLAMVGPKPDARHVAFRAEDDYTESIPLEFATADGVMLAWEMNGAPLTAKHGYPARIVGPGKFGYKGPKWLTEIMLMDEETLGYWQKRGWDREGRVHTMARIDTPGWRTIDALPYRISGIAFSGRRGISRVELSLDAGASWQDAVLKPALSPYTWVLWYYDLTSRPAGTDRIEIVVRATDGDGVLQTAEEAPPYPAGATGWHRVKASFSIDEM